MTSHMIPDQDTGKDSTHTRATQVQDALRTENTAGVPRGHIAKFCAVRKSTVGQHINIQTSTSTQGFPGNRMISDSARCE